MNPKSNMFLLHSTIRKQQNYSKSREKAICISVIDISVLKDSSTTTSILLKVPELKILAEENKEHIIEGIKV